MSLALPLQTIHGVYLFSRNKPHNFVCTSPPGHLIHLVISGSVSQRCNERHYALGRGNLLWYHDNENVEGNCLSAPWKYYSVVFQAELAPPAFSDRLARPPFAQAKATFASLHRAWNSPDLTHAERMLHCSRALAGLILLFGKKLSSQGTLSRENNLVGCWWTVENHIRQRLSEPYSVERMAQIAKTSPSTLHRACRAAVNMSPHQRIGALRLQAAQGLLIYSQLRINEIAEKCGYGRLNEFSRNFHRAFGVPPSTYRQTQIASSRSGR